MTTGFPMGYATAYCAVLAAVVIVLDAVTKTDILVADETWRFLLLAFVMIIASGWLASRHGNGDRTVSNRESKHE